MNHLAAPRDEVLVKKSIFVVDSLRWLRLILQSVTMWWAMLGVSQFLRHDPLALVNTREVAAHAA